MRTPMPAKWQTLYTLTPYIYIGSDLGLKCLPGNGVQIFRIVMVKAILDSRLFLDEEMVMKGSVH